MKATIMLALLLFATIVGLGAFLMYEAGSFASPVTQSDEPGSCDDVCEYITTPSAPGSAQAH